LIGYQLYEGELARTANRREIDMLLRNQRKQIRRGFSLMEILVVVAIIVILAGSAGFVAMNHFENAKKDLAKTNVLALDQEIGIWRTRHGDYPPDLGTLTQLGPNGEAATLTSDRLLDPWARPYAYEPQNLHPTTRKPHIYTEGPTPGAPGSRISNWEGNQ
jgi:general secretion pathway protein G